MSSLLFEPCGMRPNSTNSVLQRVQQRRSPGLQAGNHAGKAGLSGGVEEQRAGEQEAKQNRAGDFCMSRQRQGYKGKCKKKKRLAELRSHHVGHNNLAAKWWRDQVDKIGGWRVDLIQVCHSAAATPTDTQCAGEAERRGERQYTENRNTTRQ